MAPKDYYAIVEGYESKKKKDAELIRMSVWAGKSSWEGEINFHTWSSRFFPLWFDVVESVEPAKVLTAEEQQSIIERHKQIHAKKVK